MWPAETADRTPPPHRRHRHKPNNIDRSNNTCCPHAPVGCLGGVIHGFSATSIAVTRTGAYERTCIRTCPRPPCLNRIGVSCLVQASRWLQQGRCSSAELVDACASQIAATMDRGLNAWVDVSPPAAVQSLAKVRRPTACYLAAGLALLLVTVMSLVPVR